ncbi:Gfo/Idh/MocA family oxidoreductase [Actinomadura sp. ATCC 31491]|uniref:Gfo/Idh/MocA family oxidoreductase n=1 Tax=Actinomadura luzonensis TaxID=2805427 RepID=A0ABT0FIW1_9ACTN|nr:Gfo/Idh/MocA family oxidoreductase [Actinomadura luzonensis]MCK2212244.1 Gfo/Idh/MocA family oxidoreductase [Actinomadura luzonensis]
MIGVGVIGASGWAAGSHLPALAGLPEYRIAAVATTRRESAERAAARFGGDAFADAAELIGHPGVDLVVVSVRAPLHAGLIRAALAAGRHVLSEWPLTVDPAEATALAETAEAAGVAHAVALQGHHSPDARFVADLVAGGRLGRLESAVLVASGGPLGGAAIAPEHAWGADPAGGTNVLTVMAGHFLATLERMAGRLTEVSARLPRLYDEVEVAGEGRTVPNRVPNQVLLHGTLDGGGTASVTVHGSSAAPDGFLVKLVGSRAVLTATPARPGSYLHWCDWDLRVDGRPVEVPAAYRTVPFHPKDGPVANVAALYRDLAAAVAEGRGPRPGFHDAARHHRLLAAVERAAGHGGKEEIR